MRTNIVIDDELMASAFKATEQAEVQWDFLS
ncbi:MAG: type II toxin-antitoxin system VapB family antitoxin [Pseudomonadales bacterium]|nr:type II toxin-antitoxin system VapB family antitoxin [Pseudomonadales bacterium]